MNLQESKRLFREQLPIIQAQLVAPDEVFVHCIDDVSFGGKCYANTKAISNYGRVWSLSKVGEYDLERNSRNNNDYLYIERTDGEKRHRNGNGISCDRATIFRHWLVANYFLLDQKKCFEKMLDLEWITLDDVEVHHKRSHGLNIDDPFINKYDNLQFIVKVEHDIIDTIQGQQAITEETFNNWDDRKKQKYEIMSKLLEAIPKLKSHNPESRAKNVIGYTVNSITENEDGTYTVVREIVLSTNS